MRFSTPVFIFIFCVCFSFLFSAAQVNHPETEIPDTLTLEQFLQKYPNQISSDSHEKGGTRDARPNILVVMTDDSRWDSYSANGAPSFFQTPNLDKIANEGVNFKNFFAVHALCSPSRATFYTGLYSHKHGVINNSVTMPTSIPWISEILQDAGYYTVLSGKLAFSPDSIRGFDDYMIAVIQSYNPAKYSIWTGDSAIKLVIPGHTTDLLTSYVLNKMITRPPDQPFFIYLAHRAPHVPYIPRTEDEQLFANNTMPYFNTNQYSKNFPSYYYPYNQAGDSSMQTSDYLGYFRMMAGVDETFGKIYHFMDSTGLLDNTMIVYTADNGDMKSEHLLQGKQLPLEESMRLPLFIRYPAWFPNHADIYDVMGCNIDWAPTLLDAAGIPDTFGMDGVSLRALANHEVKRDAFMYEVWAEKYTPSMRAVRTPYFKYIYSFCTDTTEQLFDLINDPLENSNLINDPSYEVVAQYYRCKLDSFRNVLLDNPTLQTIIGGMDTTINSDAAIVCKLKNIDTSHIGFSFNPEPVGNCTLVVDSGITSSPVVPENTQTSNQVWEVTVYNIYGQVIMAEKRYYESLSENKIILNKEFSPGMYIVQFNNRSSRWIRKVIAQ